MRPIILLAVAVALLGLGPTCQTTPREDGGLQLIVSDLPCEQVWEKISAGIKKTEYSLGHSGSGKGLD